MKLDIKKLNNQIIPKTCESDVIIPDKQDLLLLLCNNLEAVDYITYYWLNDSFMRDGVAYAYTYRGGSRGPSIQADPVMSRFDLRPALVIKGHDFGNLEIGDMTWLGGRAYWYMGNNTILSSCSLGRCCFNENPLDCLGFSTIDKLELWKDSTYRLMKNYTMVYDNDMFSLYDDKNLLLECFNIIKNDYQDTSTIFINNVTGKFIVIEN